MKRLLIALICTAFLFIISSCGNNNSKTDCKKLIVKTWEIYSLEFNKDKLRKIPGYIDESQLNDYIKRNTNDFDKAMLQTEKDQKLLAFTAEGNILDNNSNKLGLYKLTLDCNKIIITSWMSFNHNRIEQTDTSLIKDLIDEKLILESNNGKIKTYISKN